MPLFGFLFAVIFFWAMPARAATVNAIWNNATDVPVTAFSYVASGNTIAFTLNCVPTGNELMVIENTGPAFIQGAFGNLAQGQAVALTFNSTTYNFVANYFGGNGNDLVLVPSGARAFAWGANTYGQLGDGSRMQHNTPVAVNTAGPGVLFGKTVVATAAGASHSLALCSDGTLAAWGFNYDGELGTNSTAQSQVPVAVNSTAGISALAGKTVVTVVAGELHSLALCADGTIAAWGDNYYGELGNNSSNGSLAPVAVNTVGGISALAGQTVTALAAGQYHNLALCADGTVVSWGYNTDGELGNNSTVNSLVPMVVDRSGVLAGKTVVAVAAGASHSLALCADGTIAAWGDNTYGQLGNNTTTGSSLPVMVNTAAGVSALAGKTVVAIAAGAYHSLALCSDGSVTAWGDNDEGQLGDNSTTTRLAPVAVNAATGVSALFSRSVVSIQAGQNHSVAQCTDGTVAVWGANHSGQIGDNTTTQRNVPVAVTTTALAAGERLVLAGSGANASHTLALAASVPPAVPVIAVEQPTGIALPNGGTVNFGSWIVGNPVPLTFTIRNKGTTTLTGLTLTEDGGNSADFIVTTNPAAPVAPGLSTTLTVIFTPLAAGTRTAALHIASNDLASGPFSVNLTGAGTLTGNVSAVFNSPTDIPITVSSYTATGNTINITLNCVPDGNELIVIKNTGLNFIQGQFSNLAQGQAVVFNYSGITYNFVANYYGGNGNDLVLVWAGTRVMAWGTNTSGQLGDGSTVSSDVPVAVNVAPGSALYHKTVISTAAGSNFCLALCSDGSVVSWGDNAAGELGNNSTASSLVPVQVYAGQGSALFGRSVVAIAAGYYGHSLALCSDGVIASWGEGNVIPVVVDAGPSSAFFGRTVVAVAAGRVNSLARCSDGTVIEWGTDFTTPTVVNSGVLAGRTVSDIAIGFSEHYLALCTDGTIAAWGGNDSGQLGDTTITARAAPVAVNAVAGISALAGRNVAAISAGFYHSAALCADGTVAAWGSNGSGQLGDSTFTNRLAPVSVSAVAGVSALANKSVESIAMGGTSGLALCSDGSLAQWGSLSSSTVPVAVARTSLAANERFTRIGICTQSYSGYALVSWLGAPLVTTLAATNITTTGAILHGIVNANGNNSAVTFEYGPTTAYGTTVVASPAMLTGVSATSVSATLSQLVTGSVYHYRVNADGSHGDDMTFTATQSSNPNLIELVISEGALAPVFAGSTTQYTASVTSQASSISVIPTVADFGTVTVNGASVVSGTPSSPIALAVGTNTLTIVGTSQDGTQTKTYTVTVIRPAETHTLLAMWNSSTDVPATTSHYTATGSAINLNLSFVPLTNQLTVLRNIGPDFIHGAFSNLAQGQTVALSYGGQTYNFIANYYGGSGKDLVLVWSGARAVAWGYNGYNGSELGDGTSNSSSKPVNTLATGVLAGKTVVSIAGGSYQSLALCSDGTLTAWGTNLSGQLGNSTTTNSFVPVAVNTTAGVSSLFGKTVVAIGAGYNHSMALCSDGTVATWGYNNCGQLGNNTTTDSSVPVAVNTAAGISALEGKTVVAVAGGLNHSLALCSDGTVTAWGNNGSGQLGDGTSTQRTIPVPVSTAPGSALNGKTVVAIAAKLDFSLALCSDGTVAAWGNNGFGQLGTATVAYSTIPIAVNTALGSALFGKTVVAIAAGPNHSLALCADGAVAVWGDNTYGQLGNNSRTGSPIPVAVDTAVDSALAGKAVVAIAAGSRHSLALCSDGTVATWGSNQDDQLGDNSNLDSLVPVAVDSSPLAPQDRFSGLSAGWYHSVAVVSSSVPPPLPACSPLAVNNLTLTGAQLNGTVNAQGYDTTVAFEYGTDGIAFPNSINVTPGSLHGITDVAVTTTLVGLTKGTTYFYRLKAVNQGGITYSTTASFTTRTEPTASAGSAAIASTTSALLSGTLNAHGSDTQVYFDYGTDSANLTFSVQATPAVATGYGDTLVSVVLANLAQGTTYYYRIRGTSVAGVGTSLTGSFQMAVLSGFAQVFPGPSPDAQGVVIMNMTPTNIRSGWRFVGENSWRQSGVPALGLTTGDREIEFRPVPGYEQPLGEVVPVTSGGEATILTRQYSQLVGSVTYGGLSVVIQPAALAAGSVSQSQRAQWRFLGDGNSNDPNDLTTSATWRDSGTVVSNLFPGNYLVECKPVTGRNTPRTISVTVQAGQTTVAGATYLQADAALGTPPGVLPVGTVPNSQPLPYAFVGQIRSDAGVATGFMVEEGVVATAGHVVFDDGSLSYVSGLTWSFQRERDSYEPVPLPPAGTYTFTSYAGRRTAESNPGVESPNSQNVDVAVLFFLLSNSQRDAGFTPAGGGYSGYLASDAVDNEWLESSALKVLVGYPVDGIIASSQGKMFATSPANIAFSRVAGTDSDSGKAYALYTTTQITSYGGNSGGPLCVQYNSAWYPAAIYLGGAALTTVRAIDSDVIALIQRAETSADGGPPSTGGGITYTQAPTSQEIANRGFITINITGDSGLGAWQVKNIDAGGMRRLNGDTISIVGGNYTVHFVDIPGYATPADVTVPVTVNLVASIGATYTQNYASWSVVSLAGVAAQNATALASASGDGVPNLIKYAFNLLPTVPGTWVLDTTYPGGGGTPLVQSTGTGGNTRLSITFVQRTSASAPGLNYYPEFSSDLQTWSVGNILKSTDTDGTGSWFLVTAQDPLTGLPKRYARVRVTMP